MSGKLLISETSLNANKTSTKAGVLQKGYKTCVELSWANGTGTLDATFDLKYALTSAATPTSETTDQITLSTAAGTELFWIDPHKIGYIQAFYVKNNCTNIDIIVKSADNLGGL